MTDTKIIIKVSAETTPRMRSVAIEDTLREAKRKGVTVGRCIEDTPTRVVFEAIAHTRG